MKFSKDYKTFSDWLKDHPKKSAYNKRIINAHKKYPKASLSQLRGHPNKSKAAGGKGKVKPVSKLKRKQIPDYQKKQKKFKKMHKKLHKKVAEKIKNAKQKNFPYYVFGLYDSLEVFDEKYTQDDEEPPEDTATYYDKPFYSKGIKSKDDFIDFITEEPLLAVYWIYKNNGREITFKTLAKHYGFTMRQVQAYQDQLIIDQLDEEDRTWRDFH